MYKVKIITEKGFIEQEVETDKLSLFLQYIDTIPNVTGVELHRIKVLEKENIESKGR